MVRPPPGTEALLIAACALFAVATVHGEEFSWRLPAGFPTPVVPGDNPMSQQKVQLGCRLFFDQRLSVTGAYACASCHRPELAYTDGRRTAVGATGVIVRRNAMSLTNVAYNLNLTWADRSITSLEEQMHTPLFGTHPIEMGLNEREVPPAILGDAHYAQAFSAAFPGDPAPLTPGNIVKAIAAFERTLISGRSPFDHYVFDDARDALSVSARRGMALFYSAAVGCASCHFGLNFSGPMAYAQSGERTALFANTGLYNLDARGAYPPSDQGLIEKTRNARDMGRFRVPTLRNIALTAPYMHDGSIATLEDVIDHYAMGGRGWNGDGLASGRRNRRQATAVRPLALSADQRADLAAFLRALTDERFASRGDTASCQRSDTE
jgi:cytochrome c peroxidase